MNVGKVGENLAVQYLRDNGYRIVTQNYRWRYGEIDIVCTNGNILIFVEVKARTSTMHGEPYQAVGKEKLRKIYAAGRHFAYEHHLIAYQMRIDVISIHLKPNGALHRLKHFKNVVL